MPLKTVVLVKQVPDVAEMRFDAETRTLRREGVRLEVSAFDIRALVRAVELRGELGGEVVAMTMGPPQARDALVHCLALGADRAVHLVDPAFAGSDTLATARALALALRRERFDLVLCGRSSVDAETGQVGPEVAELLDVVQVTCARTIVIDPKLRRLRAERETDAGFETVECRLPALVSVAEDVAEERFPKRADKDAAAAKPIVEVRAADLGDASEFGFAGSPTRVEAIRTLDERREGAILSGDLATAVAELARRLGERGAFAEGGVDAGPAPARAERRSGGAIWVVVEVLARAIRPVTFELLGKAGELADAAGGEVAAVLLGHGVRARVAELGTRGADRVLLADDATLEDVSTDAYAFVLARAIEERRPAAVLLPSTVFGRDVAPRVAARLGLGLTGDAIDLELDAAGRLVQWKPAFGGNVVAPILSRTSPAMVTVRPGMLAPRGPRPGAAVAVEELAVVGLPPIRTVVVDRRSAPGSDRAAALDDAAVAVGVGRGVGGPQNLPAIERFADALGAAIAATREVTDAGWLARQLQVGLTGRAISPRIYFAVGIRGAFEHMVGVRRAGTIVAINKNAKAPIFAAADFGLVADWVEALPIIESEMRKRLGLQERPARRQAARLPRARG